MFDKLKTNPLILQSLITLALRVIGVITLFGFTIFLTRNFSTDIVGQYDFSRVFLLLIGSIVLLGTDQSILFFSGKLTALDSLSSIKKLYLETVLIILVSSLFFLVLFILIPKAWIVHFFHDTETYTIIRNSIFILFFYAITLYNTEFIRALGNIYLSELFRNTFKYFPVFMGALFIVNTDIQYYLSYFYIFGFIVLALITTIIIYIKLKNTQTISEKTFITKKEIIKYSYPMGISSVIFFTFLSYDVFLLKKSYGNEIVAYYSVAIKLITFMSMVIIAFGINASTKISEYYIMKNYTDLKSIILKNNKIIFFINLIAFFIFIFFGKLILNIFGHDYVAANQSLIILSISQLIASFFGLIPIYMNMTNKGNVFKNILIFSLVIYILLNSFFIPKYGIIAASIIYSFTNILWVILCFIYVWKKDKIKIWAI